MKLQEPQNCDLNMCVLLARFLIVVGSAFWVVEIAIPYSSKVLLQLKYSSLFNYIYKKKDEKENKQSNLKNLKFVAEALSKLSQNSRAS